MIALPLLTVLMAYIAIGLTDWPGVIQHIASAGKYVGDYDIEITIIIEIGH